jgi:hypothetical protein
MDKVELSAKDSIIASPKKKVKIEQNTRGFTGTKIRKVHRVTVV